MTVKRQIRKLIADNSNTGDANAHQIWKGYGDMGRFPYGWWIKPFGGNGRWIGENWNEIQELWGE